jgi:hypothetical protein
MDVIQRRDVIKAAPARWLEQYKTNADSHVCTWGVSPRKTYGQIRAALAALNLETCQPSDIDAALGAPGWADNDCDECDKSFPVVLRIGEEPDYEARWRDVCADCLAKAAKILSETKVSS